MLGNCNLGKTSAVESPRADFIYIRSPIDRGKIGALIKSLGRNFGYTGAERYACQTGAVYKSCCSERGKAVGKDNLFKRSTFTECNRLDSCKSLREIDIDKRSTITKCAIGQC